MKMVARYNYLQCSAEYGLCVKPEAFVCLFVLVCFGLFLFFFLSSKINGIAGFDGLNFVF
jgi:hypothetical protein